MRFLILPFDLAEVTWLSIVVLVLTGDNDLIFCGELVGSDDRLLSKWVCLVDVLVEAVESAVTNSDEETAAVLLLLIDEEGI